MLTANTSLDSGTRSSVTLNPGGDPTDEKTDNVFVADLYTFPLFITIGVIGVLGNGFVILVIGLSKTMREKLTNIFIIHQSIVDLLVALFLILTVATVKHSYKLDGLWGELVCKFWLTSMPMWMAVMASTYNLVALTLERYLEICHPIKHKLKFTKVKAMAVIVGVWLVAVVHQLLIHLPTAGVVDGKCYSLYFWPSRAAKQAFGVINVTVRYVIPLIIMMLSYSAMIKVLRNKIQVHDGTGTSAGNTNNAKMMLRAKKNVFKTMLIVTVAFLVCWTANQLIFFMFNLGWIMIDFGSWWYNLSVFMVNVNCCINPFIYVAKYEAFQSSAKKLLHLDKTTVHPQDSQ